MRDGVWSQRLFASCNGCKIEARTAAAKDDRRHHDMQAIEAPRFEEPGDRGWAALDENTPQAACREALENVARVEAALRQGQGNALDSGRS